MNDARTTREIDSSRSLRSERHAAALVAQYIHEHSNRHAGARHGIQAVAGRPETSSGNSGDDA
jgi:hypothetical protein